MPFLFWCIGRLRTSIAFTLARRCLWNLPILSLHFLPVGKYSSASFMKVVCRYEDLIISIASLWPITLTIKLPIRRIKQEHFCWLVSDDRCRWQVKKRTTPSERGMCGPTCYWMKALFRCSNLVFFSLQLLNSQSCYSCWVAGRLEKSTWCGPCVTPRCALSSHWCAVASYILEYPWHCMDPISVPFSMFKFATFSW